MKRLLIYFTYKIPTFRNTIYLTKIFQDLPVKYIILTLTSIGYLLDLPLLVGIIYYERNQHYRTLINRMVTSMYWYGILWIVVMFVPTAIIFLTGPVSPFLCHLGLILHNILTIQCILHLDVIIIARYIFIFHLKNPTGGHSLRTSRKFLIFSVT